MFTSSLTKNQQYLWKEKKLLTFQSKIQPWQCDKNHSFPGDCETLFFRHQGQPCQSLRPTFVPLTLVLYFIQIPPTANGKFFAQSWLWSKSTAYLPVIWNILCICQIFVIFCVFARYLECFNGVLTSIECPYCNYYDEDKKQCNQVEKKDKDKDEIKIRKNIKIKIRSYATSCRNKMEVQI